MRKRSLLFAAAVFLCGCRAAEPPAIPQTTACSTPTEISQPGETAEQDIIRDSVSAERRAELVRLNEGKTAGGNVLNNKNHSASAGLCCYVEETDTLYFSEGGAIWQKNGDELFALAKVNAVSLNFAQGKLYFILAENDMSVFKTGSLFALDPESGEITTLYSGNVSSVVVGDTVVFSAAEKKELDSGTISISERYFECDLSGGNLRDIQPAIPPQISSDSSFGYGNYLFGEEYTYCVEENFSDNTNSLCALDKNSNIRRLNSKDYYLMDYTLAGGEIWIYDGTLKRYDSALTKGTPYYDISEAPPFFTLYSCGGRLYAASADKIYELCVNTDGTFAAVPLIEEVQP